MDRLKRFAIKKVTDGLDKVLEAKAHFDNREDKKRVEKDLIKLKETLSNKLFNSEEKEDSFQVYADLQKVSNMQRSKDLSAADKRLIKELIDKYC